MRANEGEGGAGRSAWMASAGRRARGPAPAALVALGLLAGCDRTPRPPPEPLEAAAPSADAAPAAPQPAAPSNELEPGDVRAFGLVMPVGTVERLAGPDSRVYLVAAPMPRVMRYLQRRLEIIDAEIHPLGAMVRRARVRTAAGGERVYLDVGVRDEGGEQTTVSIWRRDEQPAAPRSNEEGLRSGGVDPRTGRPLGENNY